MRRADRLFQIVQLLRSRRLVTAQALAEELGVSKRTVYRDMQDLERSGVPLRGEAGVGYALDRNYELPPMRFDAEEVEALVLGARLVRAWGDDVLAHAATRALGKVEAALPEPLREVLLQTALFAPRRVDGPPEAAELRQLRTAIRDGEVLALSYADAEGEITEREIRPLALYFWGRKWSLGAWCELRAAYRNFRVDRIETLAHTDRHFDGSDGIHLQGYLEESEAQARAEGCLGFTGFSPAAGTSR